MPRSRLRYATRSAVNTRPPGRLASHCPATSCEVKNGPLCSSVSRAIRQKLRSSSSGMPSMCSARLVDALRRFHGQRAAMSSGSPRAVNQSSRGQRSWLCRISRMPSRGIFSTGLPSRQPAARPNHAPCTASRLRPIANLGSSADQSSVITPRSIGSSCSSDSGTGLASSSSSSSSASARRPSSPSCPSPECGASACPPAASQRARTSDTSLPSSALVTSSCASRSGGWTHVRLFNDPTARPTAAHGELRPPGPARHRVP